jgi:hypothetical protein
MALCGAVAVVVGSNGAQAAQTMHEAQSFYGRVQQHDLEATTIEPVVRLWTLQKGDMCFIGTMPVKAAEYLVGRQLGEIAHVPPMLRNTILRETQLQGINCSSCGEWYSRAWEDSDWIAAGNAIKIICGHYLDSASCAFEMRLLNPDSGYANMNISVWRPIVGQYKGRLAIVATWHWDDMLRLVFQFANRQGEQYEGHELMLPQLGQWAYAALEEAEQQWLIVRELKAAMGDEHEPILPQINEWAHVELDEAEQQELILQEQSEFVYSDERSD